MWKLVLPMASSASSCGLRTAPTGARTWARVEVPAQLVPDISTTCGPGRPVAGSAPRLGRFRSSSLPTPAHRKNRSVPLRRVIGRGAWLGVVSEVLEAQHVAHGGLGHERRVVQRRAAGKLVVAGVEVERGLNLRPQERDPVQPLMEDGQEQAELQPRGSAVVPFLGSPGIGIVPPVFPVLGVGLGERAVENRRVPQQEVQDRADAASGAFLVEGVEQVVSGADQVVGVGVVRAVVAERVVAEFVQDLRDRLAVFCPRLRGGCCRVRVRRTGRPRPGS